jgi:hypothetical protein
MPDDGSYLQSYDSSHGIAQLMRELFPWTVLVYPVSCSSSLAMLSVIVRGEMPLKFNLSRRRSKGASNAKCFK